MEKRYTKAEIIEKKDDRFVAVASSAKEDRHGEIVSVEGWDIKNYKKQPRILWAHDHSIPAIGKATKVWIDGKGKGAKLMFEMVFQEVTELGRAAKKLVEDGFIDTFSVGFLPREMEGNTFTEQELLEISLVNVPANPEAMIRAYKSLSKAGFEKQTITELGIPALILDEMQDFKKEVKDIRKQLDSVVKAQVPAAPQVRSTRLLRDRQSMHKIIARASDKLLEGEKKVALRKADRTQLLKVIKAANEHLLVGQKEQINNGENR